MKDRRPRCAAETIEIDEAFASEAEACDFAEAAARDVIDGDESHGYPKPMNPKDVKSRIVGKADEHGRTVLPAEEYCEEDDVYDGLYPAPASHNL